MKTAIVHDWLFTRRGGEACWEELRGLLPGATLRALFADPGSWPAAWQGAEVVTSSLNGLPGIRRYYRWLLPLYPAAARSLTVRDAELTVSISHCAAKNVPVLSGKHLCYCLSPARYLHDRKADYLRSLPAFTRPFADAILNRLRVWDIAGAAGVDRFIAISETVARRIKDNYGCEAGIIFPPVDVDYYTPTEARPGDYYLAVAALVPYKRIDLAVAACQAAGKRLIVVGDGPGRVEMNRVAGDTTTWLPRVAREELRQLYRECRALIFPAFEDFGIAPVEALSCGRPVVAFGQGGVTETVVAGESGVFFAEQTVTDVISALERLETGDWDPARCRARAELFSRQRFRRAFAAVIDDMVNDE